MQPLRSYHQKGRFLLTPMRNNSFRRPSENVLGYNGENLTPSANWPKGTHPLAKHVGALSENVSWKAVGAFKEAKSTWVQLHQSPHLTPFAAAFWMWCRTPDLFKHAKFQLNQSRDFGAPKGREMTILYWLGASPLQQRTH